MANAEQIHDHLVELIQSANDLKIGDEHFNQTRTDEQLYACNGWIASAYNLIQIICPDPNNSYRQHAAYITSIDNGLAVNQDVGKLAALLSNLMMDVENGLLTTIADQATADTFDNFLDHAKEYLKENKKNESGVIAGVIFEDSIRRIYRKHGYEDKDQKLEIIINTLAKANIITQTKAKRAKVAAHVRTKATHAQWGAFDLKDVEGTIQYTEELISNHLK